MLATIFAPLSVTWLVGTALGAVAFGVLMLHGMAAAQLLGRLKSLLAWAGLAAVTGFLLLIATTTDSVVSANVALIYGLGALVLFLGILGTLVLVISAQNSPLERVAATQGFGRSTLLLYAVRNLSGAQGYRYYGGQSGTFRRKLVNSRSYLLSLAALADSLAPLVLITLLSIPLGIFVGVENRSVWHRYRNDCRCLVDCLLLPLATSGMVSPAASSAVAYSSLFFNLVGVYRGRWRCYGNLCRGNDHHLSASGHYYGRCSLFWDCRGARRD